MGRWKNMRELINSQCKSVFLNQYSLRTVILANIFHIDDNESIYIYIFRFNNININIENVIMIYIAKRSKYINLS